MRPPGKARGGVLSCVRAPGKAHSSAPKGGGHIYTCCWAEEGYEGMEGCEGRPCACEPCW